MRADSVNKEELPRVNQNSIRESVRLISFPIPHPKQVEPGTVENGLN